MRRLADQRGQATLMVLAFALVVAVGGAFLFAYGQAMGARGKHQRVADLAAMSAARVMRTSYPRLFEPPVLPNGLPNPHHMTKWRYLALARAAAGSAAVRNGIRLRPGDVSFPDLLSFAPTRVRVRLRRATRLALPSFGGGRSAGVPVAAKAVAAITPSATAGALTPATRRGGSAGVLAMRQGKRMRPDTAAAFDRMAAAARREGIWLSITSAFRSDAEQAQLFAAHPDPKWVAPPRRSLHRNGTELDLGPPSAYEWLARNAPRFGFVKRYAWEPWHFGHVGRASAAAGRATAAGRPSAAARRASAAGRATAAGRPSAAAGRATAAGRASAAEGAPVPAFVPTRWQRPLVRAAARWNVPVALLAAQLHAESNFNPFAISPAGARGIAQLMPETARAYGVRDPFDGDASIDAQAHLMRDLLERFKTAALALAAYNAGAGAVQRHGGIPPFAETQGYVTRVLGLMGGAGAITGGFLGIRLVE